MLVTPEYVQSYHVCSFVATLHCHGLVAVWSLQPVVGSRAISTGCLFASHLLLTTLIMYDAMFINLFQHKSCRDICLSPRHVFMPEETVQ